MRFRLELSVFRPTTILLLMIVGLCVFIGQQAIAMATCPFCSAVALTFSEQIEQQEVAVVAKLIEKPKPPETDTFDFPDGKFEIVGVLKGKKIVNTGMTFTTQVVGVYPVGQKFLIMGQGAPDIAWTTPIKTTERVFKYLQKIQKLLEFIKSPKTTINRRRLYFTMLGVCGKPEDAKMLEGLIRSDSRKQQAGLDALVGCYLTLVGKEGLPLIEERFLTNEKADYVDLTNVMDALRFHATETDIISTADIVPAVRTILDHPDHADIVIEDLARWGDWTVVDKLAKRFKELDEDDNWQRVPIAAYLLACPTDEATEHIKELEKIEPEAFARASYLHNLGNVNSDDDWDNDEFPIAGGIEGSADQESKPEDDDASKDDAKPTSTESTTIQDSNVHAALAEVPWEARGSSACQRVHFGSRSESQFSGCSSRGDTPIDHRRIAAEHYGSAESTTVGRSRRCECRATCSRSRFGSQKHIDVVDLESYLYPDGRFYFDPGANVVSRQRLV